MSSIRIVRDYPYRPAAVWRAVTDPDLHRGYLLKEGLRLVFKMPAILPNEPLGLASAVISPVEVA